MNLGWEAEEVKQLRSVVSAYAWCSAVLLEIKRVVLCSE